MASTYQKVTHLGSRHVATNEDWSPTVDGLVEVTLAAWSNGAWRVGVWGGDDEGLEREFSSENRARGCERRIGHGVLKSGLRAQGFETG